MGLLWLVTLSALALAIPLPMAQSGPAELLKEADRLAWLRAWTAAGPLFAQAEREFAAAGDQRNALYAKISHLRSELPRLAVPAASATLAEYLEHPLVRSDDRLRLRCLVIKGETDEDLDPTSAAQSWREALTIAERTGDSAWANRAKGELGVTAFLLGDVGSSVIALADHFMQPDAWSILANLIYWTVLLFIAFAKAISLAVVAFGLVASAVCALLGPIFVPFFIVPKMDWLFWGWLRSFIQYSFVPVVAIAFLMIFEQFVFRYVTTLPPMITQAEYGVYALQAFAVVATFCIGMLQVPSLTHSIFSGSSGESILPARLNTSRYFSRR